MKAPYKEAPAPVIAPSLLQVLKRMMEGDPWQAEALCASPDIDPNLFFRDVGARRDRGPYTIETRRARAICARCPVRKDCLMTALKRVEVGVWGGTTEEDRAAVRHLPEARGQVGHQGCPGCVPLPLRVEILELKLKEEVGSVRVPIDWKEYAA